MEFPVSDTNKTSISPVRTNTFVWIKVDAYKRSSVSPYNDLKSKIMSKKNYFLLKLWCKFSVSDKKKDPLMMVDNW